MIKVRLRIIVIWLKINLKRPTVCREPKLTNNQQIDRSPDELGQYLAFLIN